MAKRRRHPSHITARINKFQSDCSNQKARLRRFYEAGRTDCYFRNDKGDNTKICYVSPEVQTSDCAAKLIVCRAFQKGFVFGSTIIAVEQYPSPWSPRATRSAADRDRSRALCCRNALALPVRNAYQRDPLNHPRRSPSIRKSQKLTGDESNAAATVASILHFLLNAFTSL